MKLGLFDSGLGGLIITKAVSNAMPRLDIAYLGDTANLPYGSRSPDAIYEYTRRSVDWLFKVQDCAMVVIACNTASIFALKRLQEEYLPRNFPDRRVLGMIVPTVEFVRDRGYRRLGLIATQSTVRSGVYEKEFRKLSRDIDVKSVAAPLLVPLIENCGDKYAPEVIGDYLSAFRGIDALVLGCTHYPYYKDLMALRLPGVDIVSQDDIIPSKLAAYLAAHPDIDSRIGRTRARFFGITDMAESYRGIGPRVFGRNISIEKVSV
jgi:glutamate racemase